MRRWQSHKIVEAEKIIGLVTNDEGVIVQLADGTEVLKDWEWNNKHQPMATWYYVEYPDSDHYASVSPPEPFEAGNTEIP